MTNFKQKLKYISWIAISVIGFYFTFKIAQIINPDLTGVKSISKILNYGIITSGKSKLTLGQISLSLVLMISGIFIASIVKDKIISPILSKTQLSLGTQSSVKNLTYYFAIFASIILAFHVADVPLTIFAFLGGAIAIGLGFGSQNILNNFISGIIIQTEKPMNVGDIIEIEEVRGTVVSIGARSTKLISSSNTHIILPNSYFLDKRFINWTLYDNKVRSYIKINYTFKSNPQEVSKAILELVTSLSFIESNPEPKVLVENFNENGVEYGIYVWLMVTSTLGRAELESILRMRLYNLAKEKGYELATHSRQIHLIKAD